LLGRRFVPMTLFYRRRSVTKMLCYGDVLNGDVLSRRRFVQKRFLCAPLKKSCIFKYLFSKFLGPYFSRRPKKLGVRPLLNFVYRNCHDFLKSLGAGSEGGGRCFRRLFGTVYDLEIFSALSTGSFYFMAWLWLLV
jgi:hypothetical protein